MILSSNIPSGQLHWFEIYRFEVSVQEIQVSGSLEQISHLLEQPYKHSETVVYPGFYIAFLNYYKADPGDYPFIPIIAKESPLSNIRVEEAPKDFKAVMESLERFLEGSK